MDNYDEQTATCLRVVNSQTIVRVYTQEMSVFFRVRD